MDWRLDHSGIGVSDIERSSVFYDACLAAISLHPLVRVTPDIAIASQPTDEIAGIGYGASFPIFWIDVFHPHDAKIHTAFRAINRQEVDNFHAAAVAAGGIDNGKPGLRSKGYPPGYYAAFVLDPDGHNIEIVFREPSV